MMFTITRHGRSSARGGEKYVRRNISTQRRLDKGYDEDEGQKGCVWDMSEETVVLSDSPSGEEEEEEECSLFDPNII